MGTDIQWTDETWNPVTGCSKVSPGCAHCYAERVAIRLWPSQYPPVEYDTYSVDACCPITEMRARVFTDVQCHEDRLDQPLRWKKPRKVFVNSMSDLFHEDVPDAFIARVFNVMSQAQRHTFQILTKRAARMLAYASSPYYRTLPNVWLGVSVENQHFADERIPLLLQTPAAVRFISAEPLLEATNLHLDQGFCRACQRWTKGTITGHCFDPKSPCFSGEMAVGDGIDWVIVGGESGAGARPFEVAWARSIVAQCQGAGVACFVKQLGRNVVVRNDGERDERWPGCTVPIGDDYEPRYQGEDAPLDLRDSHGGDPAEWPTDLRVRQFPKVNR